MNITTRHIFTAFSIQWDEQQFPGLSGQAPANQSTDFPTNLPASQTPIGQSTMPGTTNQPISDQKLLAPAAPANFSKHSRKSTLFSPTVSTKKSHKISKQFIS